MFTVIAVVVNYQCSAKYANSVYPLEFEFITLKMQNLTETDNC